MSISINNKNSQKSKNRRQILQPDKGHPHKNPTANIILTAKRLNTFHLKRRNKERLPAFTTSIQYCTRGTSQCNWARKRNKIHPDLKGKSNSIFICR